MLVGLFNSRCKSIFSARHAAVDTFEFFLQNLFNRGIQVYLLLHRENRLTFIRAKNCLEIERLNRLSRIQVFIDHVDFFEVKFAICLEETIEKRWHNLMLILSILLILGSIFLRFPVRFTSKEEIF